MPSDLVHALRHAGRITGTRARHVADIAVPDSKDILQGLSGKQRLTVSRQAGNVSCCIVLTGVMACHKLSIALFRRHARSTAGLWFRRSADPGRQNEASLTQPLCTIVRPISTAFHVSRDATGRRRPAGEVR